MAPACSLGAVHRVHSHAPSTDRGPLFPPHTEYTPGIDLPLPMPQVSDRRKVLLKYVQEVEPGMVEQFNGPAPVVATMRQTVHNMIGHLPPQFFRVTVASSAENIAQLMYSVLM